MFGARILALTLLSLSGLHCEETNQGLQAEQLREYYQLCSQLCEEQNRECSLSSGSCGNCLSGYKEDHSLSQCVAKTHQKAGSPDSDRWKSFKVDESIDDAAKQQEKHVETDTLNKETSNPDLRVEGTEHKYRVNQVHHHPHQSHRDKLQQLNLLKVKNGTPHAHPTPARQVAHPKHSKVHQVKNAASMADVYFLAIVASCSVAGLVGLVVAGVCWYRLQKNVKAASEAEYPAYGVTGPTTKDPVTSPGDRKLAQSAQMYHYQHQKQQMIALEKANSEMKHDASDEDSEEENEEGDYTVYECPGLAPTGEMEVKNPLFSDDTPATPPSGDQKEDK